MRRVLIVKIGAMGDVLHALPAVTALRTLHPEWQIDWAVDPRWAPLLSVPSVVNQLYMVPTRAWKKRPFSIGTARQILGLKRALQSNAYDLCMDLQGTIRSSVVGKMAVAKRFVGLEAPRERIARMFYGEKIAVTSTHVVEQACELLGAAVGETLTPAAVSLSVDDAAEAWCSATIARACHGRPFVMMAPSAGWGAKQWPPERFGAVAAALAQKGYLTLISTVPNSNDAPAYRAAAASEGAAQVVPCNIPQLIALLRRAELMIGGDTGPLHLAAALGRPVVGIYGPTDPARNGPYGTVTRVLRHPSSEKDHHRRAQTEAGLLQIASVEVTAAALDLLRPPTLETA